MGLRAENTVTRRKMVSQPSLPHFSLGLGAPPGGKTINVEDNRMAATGQEARPQSGRRGLGGSSLRPGCGRGGSKVEQVPGGPRTWEVASVSACSQRPQRWRERGQERAWQGQDPPLFSLPQQHHPLQLTRNFLRVCGRLFLTQTHSLLGVLSLDP